MGDAKAEAAAAVLAALFRLLFQTVGRALAVPAADVVAIEETNVLATLIPEDLVLPWGEASGLINSTNRFCASLVGSGKALPACL